jgi:hypothetical protein
VRICCALPTLERIVRRRKIRVVKNEEPYRKGERMPKNDQVRIEMQAFLKALVSYPESFASNPKLTFEQYRSSLIVAQGSSTGPSHPPQAV